MSITHLLPEGLQRLGTFFLYKSLSLVFLITIVVLFIPTHGAHAQDTISGPDKVCVDENEVEFHISGATECSEVYWTSSDGSVMSIAAGVNDPYTGVAFPSSPGSGNLVETVLIKFEGEGCDEGSSLYDEKEVKVINLDAIEIELQTNNITCLTEFLKYEVNGKQYTENYNWAVPSGWSIEPSSQENGKTYCATCPQVKVRPNGEFNGTKTVSIKFDPSSDVICDNSFPYEKEYDVNISTSCLNNINYSSKPGYHQSHSDQSTTFNGPSIDLDQNHDFYYISGGSVELLPSFEYQSASTSSMNLFIEECDCSSPYHDPELLPTGTTNKRLLDTTQGFKSSNSINGFSSKKFNISVYPNPNSDGHFNISGSNIKSIRQVFVYGRLGKLVQRVQYSDLEQNINSVSFRLDDVIKGLYFIEIHTLNNKKYYEKVLVHP